MNLWTDKKDRKLGEFESGLWYLFLSPSRNLTDPNVKTVSLLRFGLYLTSVSDKRHNFFTWKNFNLYLSIKNG